MFIPSDRPILVTSINPIKPCFDIPFPIQQFIYIQQFNLFSALEKEVKSVFIIKIAHTKTWNCPKLLL